MLGHHLARGLIKRIDHLWRCVFGRHQAVDGRTAHVVAQLPHCWHVWVDKQPFVAEHGKCSEATGLDMRLGRPHRRHRDIGMSTQQRRHRWCAALEWDMA
ncbi:hypothetical protein D3C85_1607310 [compost metagenome]